MKKKITFKFIKIFQNELKEVKNDLVSFVDKNYPIIGYGASTKGNIVLNYCKLTSQKINYVCDANTRNLENIHPDLT